MTLEEIKSKIYNHLNHQILIKVNGMRNKTDIFKGTLNAAYPNIFTVCVNGENKSFRYADILTGEINVKYL